jgi:hypothetical protein
MKGKLWTGLPKEELMELPMDSLKEFQLEVWEMTAAPKRLWTGLRREALMDLRKGSPC